jgi:hypothetical protein
VKNVRNSKIANGLGDRRVHCLITCQANFNLIYNGRSCGPISSVLFRSARMGQSSGRAGFEHKTARLRRGNSRCGCVRDDDFIAMECDLGESHCGKCECSFILYADALDRMDDRMLGWRKHLSLEIMEVIYTSKWIFTRTI